MLERMQNKTDEMIGERNRSGSATRLTNSRQPLSYPRRPVVAQDVTTLCPVMRIECLICLQLEGLGREYTGERIERLPLL